MDNDDVKQEHVRRFLKEYDNWKVTKEKNGSVTVLHTSPVIGYFFLKEDLTLENVEDVLTEMMAVIGN